MGLSFLSNMGFFQLSDKTDLSQVIFIAQAH